MNKGAGEEVVFFVTVKKLEILEIALWKRSLWAKAEESVSAAAPLMESAVVEMADVYLWYDTGSLIDLSLGHS